MLTTARPVPIALQVAKRASDFAHWLKTHRGTVAMAGLLAFAGPLTFFAGALSVMPSLMLGDVARVGLWWTFYGFSLWCALLLAGYLAERFARLFRRYVRAVVWLLAACSAAVLPNVLTAGRATILMEQGLVYNARTMHLHGFTMSLIMALLYFAHLRRSREHEEATARLAAAQAAQRNARHRIVQARLQEMQARVDPEILFEMLDTVRRLYGRDAALAERFLDELIVFLRAALPRLRTASSSLPREVELALAFVELHALAGTPGLDMAIDVAPDAMHARFPPGVLLPLLDAAAAGSATTCRLTAVRAGEDCRVVLSAGTAPSERSIARVRSLLKELYGMAARLEIEAASGAFKVVVTIPYEHA